MEIRPTDQAENATADLELTIDSRSCENSKQPPCRHGESDGIDEIDAESEQSHDESEETDDDIKGTDTDTSDATSEDEDTLPEVNVHRRFRTSRKRIRDVSSHDDIDSSPSSSGPIKTICATLLILVFAILAQILYRYGHLGRSVNTHGAKSFQINFESIEKIEKQHPDILSTKKVRVIKTRLLVMQHEVSVLMLLGRTRDTYCNDDITFCLAQSIVNATQTRSGYIYAADPSIRSDDIERELGNSFVHAQNAVIIDSLESLPGTAVMNLFQFIDKDDKQDRRGMLLFTIYTGHNTQSAFTSLKEADIAERVLLDNWSPYIAKDSLTSVISRLCKTIVKVY